MKYNRVINKNSTANVFKISLLRTVFFGLFFTFCLNINSQSKLSNLSNLTEKGIIYFMLKVNQNALTDDCIKTIFTNTRWFDLYVNHFDKENYDYFSKDEFKWPSYSQKIVSEMLNGIEKSDFNKLYTCICTATLGQYDTESKKFPVELRFYPILQVGERRFSNIVTFNIAGRNLEYFDLALEMDLDIAEKFIDSRKDANGNIDRNIEAQVVFNVVNTSNDDLNRGDAKYLGVYIHSITFFDGSKIFGEIKPQNDFYDKVNLIYEAPVAPVLPPIETQKNGLTDIDGNVYQTVIIGTQTWMVENLKTTKYNDGTSIPNVTDGTTWTNLSTPGYCFYNNDAANKNTYGALYNWHTVNTGKLAPRGWHIPTDAEWTTLENYLIANGYNYDGTTTGNKISKSLAANTLWNTNTTVGTIGNDLTKNNTSGFAGLPGGYRESNGAFHDIGDVGMWWSSPQEDEQDYAWYRYMYSGDIRVVRDNSNKQLGFSVRCLRD